MKVQYRGRRAREVVPATGARPFHVQPGDTVEVDAATGRSLTSQRRLWAEVKPAKKKPATSTPDDTKENNDG